MNDQPPRDDLLNEVRDEIVGIAREGMAHPSTKPVLTGAAVGAVAGLVLPVVSWPLGLVAGGAWMLYKRVRP